LDRYGDPFAGAFDRKVCDGCLRNSGYDHPFLFPQDPRENEREPRFLEQKIKDRQDHVDRKIGADEIERKCFISDRADTEIYTVADIVCFCIFAGDPTDVCSP
jgi:hypothetical protein